MIRIEKQHPAFKALRLAVKTKGADTIKPVFYYLYKADETTLVSSDSRRLLVIDVSLWGDLQDLPIGYYEVVKNSTKEVILTPVSIELSFPDYKKIIPTTYTDTIDVYAMIGDTLVKGKKLARSLYNIAQKGVLVNARYMTDILELLESDTLCGITGPMSPLVVEYPRTEPYLKYVVMPIQVND